MHEEIKYSQHHTAIFVFTCPNGGVWVRGGWALGGIIVIWGWSFGTWFLFIRKDWAGLRLICKQVSQKKTQRFQVFWPRIHSHGRTQTNPTEAWLFCFYNVTLKYRASHTCTEIPPKAHLSDSQLIGSYWCLVLLVSESGIAPFRCSMLETQEDT